MRAGWKLQDIWGNRPVVLRRRGEKPGDRVRDAWGGSFSLSSRGQRGEIRGAITAGLLCYRIGSTATLHGLGLATNGACHPWRKRARHQSRRQQNQQNAPHRGIIGRKQKRLV